MNRVTITRPDDWHLHLRDGAAMASVLPATAARFARAIVMPNLMPPITTTDLAAAYRSRIHAALPPGISFEPLMTLYLTDTTSAGEISKAKRSSVVHGIKFYPRGATTNSASGVTAIENCREALAAMEQHDLPLLVHGEVNDPDVDVFDRESVFIDRVLAPLLLRYPKLRVVLEHLTTADAVEFIEQSRPGVAATITAHHLLLNRNALFSGGLRPHHYCLPVLKREKHRRALLKAATSGNPKFFLGSDSAPHSLQAKESACGCAGVYTAFAGIELYAEVFAAAGALNRLEGFASFFGADFYRLPRNAERITLIDESWQVPRQLPFGNETLAPLRAGGNIGWRLASA
ncbi:MAG: dihydroorotase [Burkholderiales bacterium]|nr:dihydroorotase [Burkholderiales bacterium]